MSVPTAIMGSVDSAAECDPRILRRGLSPKAPRRLATVAAFDPARAAVEGSVAKALTLLAIAASDLVAAHPGRTLNDPDCPRAHARPTKDVSVKK